MRDMKRVGRLNFDYFCVKYLLVRKNSRGWLKVHRICETFLSDVTSIASSFKKKQTSRRIAEFIFGFVVAEDQLVLQILWQRNYIGKVTNKQK